MLFDEILGQTPIKNHLLKSADTGRIPHAQLFVGPEGSGTLPMAIAYARHILCNGKTEDINCNQKVEQLAHPDLHFAFPVASNSKVKSHPVSSHFMDSWRSFVKEQPYGNLFDWYRLIGIENKQGQIGVDEAAEINKALSLKSFEGGYKIMLVWMAEKMNNAAANKLLKILEEPADKTLFILITENEEHLIQTIRSRCQILHFHPIATDVIKSRLLKMNVSEKDASKISHRANGNFNKALDLLHNDSEDLIFEKWFVSWVRSAFKAKANKQVINELIQWSEELAGSGREVQKQFLHYCIDVFRQALLSNYNAKKLVFMDLNHNNFHLDKFAAYIHGGNINAIYKELGEAIYHIERNGNAKIVFTDLSIKLTRLLHKKSV